MQSVQWRPCSSPKLIPNVIHLWHLPLQPLDMDYRQSILNNEEQQRAARYYFDIHRQRFIMARASMRMVLSQYLNIAPQDIVFEYAKRGKPYLSAYPEFHFNLSHSENSAVLAIRETHPVGVDIEFFKQRDLLGLAKHSFSNQEFNQLVQLSKFEQTAAFYHIWSQKEAFIKVLGHGLSYPLKSFSVSATAPASLLEIAEGQTQDWYIKSFKFADNAWCAVVSPRPILGMAMYCPVFSN